MKKISKILEGEINPNNDQPDVILNASDISCMKYAPINIADVECNFSMHKNLLADHQRNLTFEHIN